MISLAFHLTFECLPRIFAHSTFFWLFALSIFSLCSWLKANLSHGCSNPFFQLLQSLHHFIGKMATHSITDKCQVHQKHSIILNGRYFHLLQECPQNTNLCQLIVHIGFQTFIHRSLFLLSNLVSHWVQSPPLDLGPPDPTSLLLSHI